MWLDRVDGVAEELQTMCINDKYKEVDGDGGEDEKEELLPLLPPELWLVVMGFFLRMDWDVPRYVCGVKDVTELC